MKLHNLDHSPYASRVRALIRKAQLDVAIVAPGAALRTEAFLQRYPMGKIPVLELDDGTQIPDSWVIMEYLDAVAGAGLSPDTPLAKAQMQLLVRYGDTYLSPGGLFPLFQLITTPGETDKEAAAQAMAGLHQELARFERLLGTLPDFRERGLHLGDIALAPQMDFVGMLGPLFGEENPLQAYPLAQGWYDWVQGDAAVAATSREMGAAVRAFLGP